MKKILKSVALLATVAMLAALLAVGGGAQPGNLDAHICGTDNVIKYVNTAPWSGGLEFLIVVVGTTSTPAMTDEVDDAGGLLAFAHNEGVGTAIGGAVNGNWAANQVSITQRFPAANIANVTVTGNGGYSGPCQLVCCAVEPHTCVFGAWTETAPATCTDAGSRTRSCECGETETEAIAALGCDECDDCGECTRCGECECCDHNICPECDECTLCGECDCGGVVPPPPPAVCPICEEEDCVDFACVCLVCRNWINECTCSDETTVASTATGDASPPTGVAMAIIPTLIAAGAALVVSKKRK